MKEKVFDGIVEKVRNVASSGRRIAVLGWRESEHTMPTRKMAARVGFFEKPPSDVVDFGLVVVLKPLESSNFRHFRSKECEVVPTGLTISQIKGVLHRCERDLVCANPQAAPVGHEPAPVPAPGSLDQLAAQIVTNKEGVNVSALDAFCKAFAEKAMANGGRVSKMVVGAMLKEHQVELTAMQLKNQGYIIPIIPKGGTKAGQYEIGPEMGRIIVAEKLEPTDPIDKARYLIDGEEGFHQELARLKAKLQAERDRIAAELAAIEESHKGPIEAIESKLARVAKAKELMRQLNEV